MKICDVKGQDGRPCGTKIALKDYANHLREVHKLDLIVNPLKTYTKVKEQVEYIYDLSNAAINSDGVLVDLVLRSFYGLAIYDAKTQHIQIDIPYDVFMDYLTPLFSTITRAGRELRAEATDNPGLHPSWKFSEHVRVRRQLKEGAYRMFFSASKV